jgi:hypothetical protein
MMKWVGHLTCMGEKGNAHKILVRKPEEKISLGIPSLYGRMIVTFISSESWLTRGPVGHVQQ